MLSLQSAKDLRRVGFFAIVVLTVAIDCGHQSLCILKFSYRSHRGIHSRPKTSGLTIPSPMTAAKNWEDHMRWNASKTRKIVFVDPLPTTTSNLSSFYELAVHGYRRFAATAVSHWASFLTWPARVRQALETTNAAHRIPTLAPTFLTLPKNLHPS